ncbi:hypothetical protein DOTSEDRAFT_72005 [Dothistroma septosporum NZE10]|uniref:RNase H type-1 domain-containing protein n=1 Tax=Dothistroma septosporum (strain NZE10 / CBS 128990) TaxID=675120 RepID=N1PN65_DOTSN|nr:hypothetical protein DOTSEDRAFT_72005 [Dothistroma septosporum NZE10]
MASQHEVIDLTGSDDDLTAILPRPPTARQDTRKTIEISDDDDEVEIASDSDDGGNEHADEDLVGPLLAALAGPQNDRLPFELPPARAPMPASPRHNTPVRGAEVVMHLFADGSFVNGRFGGAGVAWRDKIWHGRAIALGRVKDSFAAEMHAVLEGIKAAHAIVDRRSEFTKVVVQTDCESCLIELARARAAGGGHYGLLDEIIHQEALLKSRGLDVVVWWVKGHSDSVGNDIADSLARYGAERARTSPTCWGVVIENPPSMKLELANRLRHSDRKPHQAITAPGTRRAKKEAKRRARG